jgi:D-alanine--poly(phosphoribitol) ligase subunit 2
VDDLSSILRRLGELFAETFHIDVPSPDMDLLERGVLDSLQMVELLFQLERRFGFRVKIDELDLDNLRTLSRIARLLAAQGAAPDATASQPTARVAHEAQ